MSAQGSATLPAVMGRAESDAARALAEARWKGVSEKERREHQADAAKALWDGMSETERAEFLKKRGDAISLGRGGKGAARRRRKPPRGAVVRQPRRPKTRAR